MFHVYLLIRKERIFRSLIPSSQAEHNIKSKMIHLIHMWRAAKKFCLRSVTLFCVEIRCFVAADERTNLLLVCSTFQLYMKARKCVSLISKYTFLLPLNRNERYKCIVFVYEIIQRWIKFLLLGFYPNNPLS